MTTLPPDDIIQLIREDHGHIRQRLADVLGCPRELRAAEFWKLTHRIVRHEVAEEVVVYPALRHLPGGDTVADACILEQSEAEALLASMEDMDATTDKFASSLESLRDAVLSHAEHEESEVLTLLGQEDTGRLMEMGRRYQAAKDSAPTHPHPHAPDEPPGNKIVGRLQPSTTVSVTRSLRSHDLGTRQGRAEGSR